MGALGAIAGCSDFDLESVQETEEEFGEPLFDPEFVEWTTAMASDDDLVGEVPGGEMLVNIESHPVGAQRPLLYGISHENIQHVKFDTEFDWQVHWDLDRGDFGDKNENLRQEGYRLIDQTHYHREIEDDGSGGGPEAGNGDTISSVQEQVEMRHTGV